MYTVWFQSICNLVTNSKTRPLICETTKKHITHYGKSVGSTVEEMVVVDVEIVLVGVVVVVVVVVGVVVLVVGDVVVVVGVVVVVVGAVVVVVGAVVVIVGVVVVDVGAVVVVVGMGVVVVGVVVVGLIVDVDKVVVDGVAVDEMFFAGADVRGDSAVVPSVELSAEEAVTVVNDFLPSSAVTPVDCMLSAVLISAKMSQHVKTIIVRLGRKTTG